LDLFSDTGFLGRLSCSPDKALNEVYPNNPIAAFRKLDGVPTNAAPSVQQRRSWLKTQLRDDTIDLSGRVLHPLVRRIKEHSRIGFLDNAILIRKQLLQILNGQAALRLGPEGDCKPFHAGTQRAEWPGILVHTESLQLFRDSGVVYEKPGVYNALSCINIKMHILEVVNAFACESPQLLQVSHGDIKIARPPCGSLQGTHRVRIRRRQSPGELVG